MNVKYLGIGLVLLAVIAGAYFVMSESATTPTPTTPVETATTTEESDPENIELDLSKLQGKDRLYTEEEGRYENLSEEERRLLAKAQCEFRKSNVYGRTNTAPIVIERGIANFSCDEKAVDVKDDQLVTLKDGIAVISTPHVQTNGILYIYNIQNHEILGKHTDYWNTAYGPSYIVRHEDTLILYRPGMREFIEIPESKLDSDLTYLKWTEIIIREFPVEFDANIITVTIYKHNCDGSPISEFAGLPVECTNEIQGTKIFNLSNLR